MKTQKTHHILLLALSLFSINAYSVVGAMRPNLHSGMQGGENCGMQSTQGSASQLSEINCMLNPESCLHRAAWYQDRDNSMSPVSTEEGVGAAMAIIDSKNGYTQGIQVCPGVYLATAHGALDNPENARREGRALRDPNNNMQFIDPYPMSDDEFMEIENARFTSPRLRNPSTWNDPTTDYVFIQVSNPTRPNNVVRPVRASNQRLIEAANRGQADVHLYRPPTRFDTDSSGTPVFDNGMQARTFEQVSPLYDAPLRVEQACELRSFSSALLGSSCPTEQSVSGSSQVFELDGENYLAGLHVRGDARSYGQFNDDDIPNSFIQSSHFCEDYESVCGQPCAELDEVLPDGDDGISI